MLQLLPFELILFIVKEITIYDVHSLSLTCKYLRFLVEDETTCRRLLEVCHPIHPVPKWEATLTALDPTGEGTLHAGG